MSNLPPDPHSLVPRTESSEAPPDVPSMGAQLQALALRFLAVVTGGTAGIATLAAGSGFLAHQAHLQMLGVTPFALSARGYSWIAFNFLTDSLWLALESLRSLMPLVLLGLIVALLAMVVPHIVHTASSSGPRVLHSPWATRVPYFALMLALVLLSASLVQRSARPLSEPIPTATSAQADTDRVLTCSDLLCYMSIYGKPGDEDAPVPSFWLRARGLDATQIRWCLFRRSSLLPIAPGAGAERTEVPSGAATEPGAQVDATGGGAPTTPAPVVAGGSPSASETAAQEPPEGSGKQVTLCGGDLLGRHYGDLVLANVLLLGALVGARRWRKGLVAQPAPNARNWTYHLCDVVFEMPVLVMLVLSLILLPQNYGALVMPPSYTMLEIPDDPTLRGEIGDNVYEAYLLSISPQDADELVLLSFPVTQNPRYEMIWMIQRVPAERFRNLRTVGRSDILAEDLPVQQLTTRLDAAKALARHCVGRFGGKLMGGTYEDAVTYLAEQMVIAPAEVPGFMSGQDVQVTAAELLRWTIVASVAEPKREELQSLMAEHKPKALRDALERFGCKYNLFANYPEDNVKARLALERRTAYLMMRRVGAIPQERLIADMVAAL